jgi:hypothetical protein
MPIDKTRYDGRIESIIRIAPNSPEQARTLLNLLLEDVQYNNKEDKRETNRLKRRNKIPKIS